MLSADGRYLLYAASGATPDTATLKILDMETGQASVLTTRYPVPGWSMGGRVPGPGGAVNRDEDEFFFWEKDGGALLLKAATPSGEARVLRSFGDAMETVAVAVFHDRLAYLEHGEGTATIVLADAGKDEARRILTVDGFLDVLTWSPDGKWLAATKWPIDGAKARVMLIRV